jgi:hypothetical protein
MGAGTTNGAELSEPGRVPVSELPAEVSPLVAQLPSALGQGPGQGLAAQLPSVKAVAPDLGLGKYGGEVGIDGLGRVGRGSEPKELGMMPVATSLAPENGPGEQGLAPEGY